LYKKAMLARTVTIKAEVVAGDCKRCRRVIQLIEAQPRPHMKVTRAKLLPSKQEVLFS